MKIPAFSSNDLSIENFIPPTHIQTDLKKRSFFDGSIDHIKMGVRAPLVDVTFNKMPLGMATGLKDFFYYQSLNDIDIEIYQEFLFGSNIANVKSWVCTAQILEINGNDTFTQSGLHNSLKVRFSLKKINFNDNTSLILSSQLENDFYIKIFPNAIICDVFKTNITAPNNFVLGVDNLLASLVPEALDGDFVFIKTHTINSVLNKKGYLYKRIGSNLVLQNHLNYSDVNFTDLVGYDVAKFGDSALVDGKYYKLAQSINPTWVENALPAVSQFKRVILSTENAYIQRGTNFIGFWYYSNNYLAQNGLRLPKKNINIENGASVEYPNGFELTLANEAREHWKSLNFGFYGSTAEVWHSNTQTMNLVCKGICIESDEGFSGYNLKFEPLGFNLYEKVLNLGFKRSVYGVWEYVSSEIENKDNLFKLYESVFGSTNVGRIRVSHNLPTGKETRYFLKFGTNGEKFCITEAGQDQFGKWLKCGSKFDYTPRSGMINFYEFKASFLIDSRYVDNAVFDREILAYQKDDADNLKPFLSGAWSYDGDLGRVVFQNTRQTNIKISDSGQFTTDDDFNLAESPLNYDAFFANQNQTLEYSVSIPNITGLTYIGNRFYLITGQDYGHTLTHSFLKTNTMTVGLDPNDAKMYIHTLNANQVNGAYPRLGQIWNNLRYLNLFEAGALKFSQGDKLFVNYLMTTYYANTTGYSGSDGSGAYFADVLALKKDGSWVTLATAWQFNKGNFEYKDTSEKLSIDLPNDCFVNGVWDITHIAFLQYQNFSLSSIRCASYKTIGGRSWSTIQIRGLLNKDYMIYDVSYEASRMRYFATIGSNNTDDLKLYYRRPYSEIAVSQEYSFGSDIYFKNFLGRYESRPTNTGLSKFVNEYNNIYSEMCRSANIPVALLPMPSKYFYDKLRFILDSDFSYKDLLEKIALHSFCGLRILNSGDYQAFDLDVKNLNPVYYFNQSNIIDGSFDSVDFRNGQDIANATNVNFHYSAITEKLTRSIKNYVKGENIYLEGLEPTDFDRYEKSASDYDKSSLKGSLSQLKNDLDFSRTFYGVASQTIKEFTLDWFYDASFWESSDPLSAPVKWIERASRFFLFNSWRFNFETKIELFLGSSPLKIGDYIAINTYFHSDSIDVFGFIYSIDLDLSKGTAKIGVYAPIPPEVRLSLYDNIWNGGIIDENYVLNDYKHKEILNKYPFKTSSEGSFSDGGIIDANYNLNNLQFIDNTFADPKEQFTPLP